MGRARRTSERAERVASLLAAGDHGAARRLSAALLGDAGASDDEREAAAAAVARTDPDRAVVIAGVGGLAAALAISLWLVLH